MCSHGYNIREDRHMRMRFNVCSESLYILFPMDSDEKQMIFGNVERGKRLFPHPKYEKAHDKYRITLDSYRKTNENDESFRYVCTR